MTDRCINLSAAEARAWAAGATALIRPVNSRDGGHPDIHDMKWRDGDVLIGREAFADDWADTVGVQYIGDGGIDAEMWDAGVRMRSASTMPAFLARHRRRVVSVRVCQASTVTDVEWDASGINDFDDVFSSSGWVSVTMTEAA